MNRSRPLLFTFCAFALAAGSSVRAEPSLDVRPECRSMVQEHDAFLGQVSSWTVTNRLHALESRLLDGDDPGNCVMDRLFDRMSSEIGGLVYLETDNGAALKPTHIFYCDKLNGLECRGVYADDTAHLAEMTDIASIPSVRLSDVSLVINSHYPAVIREAYLSDEGALHAGKAPRKIKLDPNGRLVLKAEPRRGRYVLFVLIKGDGYRLTKKAVWLLTQEKQ